MTSLFFSIPLLFVSTTGLILNGYILTIFVLTKQVRTANNILLFHLGTVDILLAVLFITFSLPIWKGAEWPKTGIPCIFHGFFFTLLHPVALWTICGLNCDRYYVIAAPLHYTHLVSTKKIIIGLGTGWIVAFLLCMPPLFKVAPYKYIPGLEACGPDFSEVGTLWYSSIYTGLTLLLPATIIICCNLKILMIARYHRHRIASAIYEVTLSAQVTITHQRNPFFVPTITSPNSGYCKTRNTSAVCSVFQIVGSFLFLYSPYYMIIIWESAIASNSIGFGSSKMSLVHLYPSYYSFALVLLITALSVNGFLYGIKSQILRKTFRNYWRKKQTQSELNQEIQARTPSTCGSRRPSLTPFGFLTKPPLQRRLSETFTNRTTRSPICTNKMKRIASEITWRKTSSDSLNNSPKEEYVSPIKQTSSCSKLQVPVQDVQTITEGGIYFKAQPRSSSPVKNLSPNAILSKIFGLDQSEKPQKVLTTQGDLPKTLTRSPRILITRAFSEESEKSSRPNTPNREMSKIHSTSATTLLDKKWRHLRYKEDVPIHHSKKATCPRPSFLADNISMSNRSSKSSESSGLTSSKAFLSNELSTNEIENESSEDQLLLSYNVYKKYSKNEDIRKTRSNTFKQTILQS